MPHPFDAREISAWIAPERAERASRVLSDPRLRPTRVGSADARTRRTLAERFDAEAFDDLRRLAVATPSALWIDRPEPLGESDAEALGSEDVAVVAGACSLPFLLAIPQCETAPSFRRMNAGRTLEGISEAFGRIDVVQAAVGVADETRLAEGLRAAVAAALSVLGPLEEVTAIGGSQGILAASLLGERGFGTLAVGRGGEGVAVTLVGEGGIASITSALAAWRRRDGATVEETPLPPDGDEPIVATILESERPSERSRNARDLARQRSRLRIAAAADAIRLSARTGQAENVHAMLERYGVDPETLELPAA